MGVFSVKNSVLKNSSPFFGDQRYKTGVKTNDIDLFGIIFFGWTLMYFRLSVNVKIRNLKSVF